MTTVPYPLTPPAFPVAEFIVATAELLLSHVPPVVALLNVSVDPLHTLVPPVMGDVALTVRIAVDVHVPDV